jgi:monoamine oxidase
VGFPARAARDGGAVRACEGFRRWDKRGDPGERRRRPAAYEQGDKLHDGYSNAVEHGLGIGRNNMEFERMAWADEGDPSFAQHARTLSEPQGRFHMAGDQLTYWSGWQEGALISAQAAVASIDRLAKAGAKR